MADADIKLDGGTAIVEGNWLLVKCWDIKLDADDRRKQSGGHRRALVHGFNDELVLNWADDYPGGVTIAGEVKIPGKVKQNHVRLESTDLHIDHPDRRKQSGGHRRALVHGFNDELVLNYAKDYPGGTVVQGNFEVQRGGTVSLKNDHNDVIVKADKNGNLWLGGGGQDGDVVLKDGDGKTIIHMDAQHHRIQFQDPSGSVKVLVDSDHFTEADWPAWPDGTSPSRLDLIKELRRMKEEILTLRTQVDELMAG